VVLDTNVLVAAFGTRGLCEAVYQVCLARHEIVLSEHILKETRRALCAKMKLTPQHADEIVSALRDAATIVQPAKVPANACRDQNDLPILGTLLAGQADCLVTGDQDLLELKEFRAIPILSPRVFHDRLRA
jgi:putative PIN family toxin of toxin-antitoxin system